MRSSTAPAWRPLPPGTRLLAVLSTQVAGHTLLPPANLGPLSQALTRLVPLPPFHPGAVGGSSDLSPLCPLPFVLQVVQFLFFPSSGPQSCVAPHSQRTRELPGWGMGRRERADVTSVCSELPRASLAKRRVATQRPGMP